MKGRYEIVYTLIFMIGCASSGTKGTCMCTTPDAVSNDGLACLQEIKEVTYVSVDMKVSETKETGILDIEGKECLGDDQSQVAEETKDVNTTEVFGGAGTDVENKDGSEGGNDSDAKGSGEEIKEDVWGKGEKWCNLPPYVSCYCAHIEGCKAEPLDCCLNDPSTCPNVIEVCDESHFWHFQPIEVSLLDEYKTYPISGYPDIEVYDIPGCQYVLNKDDYLLVVSYNASFGFKCSCGEGYDCPFFGYFLLVHLVSIKDKKAYLILRYPLNEVEVFHYEYWPVPWSLEPYCNPNLVFIGYDDETGKYYAKPSCRITLPKSFFVEGVGLVKYDYSYWTAEYPQCGFEDPVHNVLWIDGEEVPLPLN